MTQKSIEQLITAYADEEITDDSEVEEVKSLIKNNKSAQFEYEVQLLIKSLVSERLKTKPAPARIKNKILKKINPSKFISFLPAFISGRQLIIYGSAIVLFTAILLLIFNRPPQNLDKNFPAEQSGKSNFYLQARENFKKIMAGELTPQFFSNNPEEVKSFFKNEGVSYDTYVPAFNKWNLMGAIVSVDNGKKLSHHIYIDIRDELIYLFQVNEHYFKSNKILNLSEGLMNYLNNGNCYIVYEDNLSTLISKTGDNIIAVVSLIPAPELEKDFCNLN